MEQFIADLQKLLWILAPTAIIALCGYTAKRGHRFFNEHAANNQVAAEHGELKERVSNLESNAEVQSGGIKTIIKSLMVTEHARLVHQRYATPHEKDHFEEMHETYKALGGNGTGTALYKDVMQMYSIAPAEFEEES